VCVFNVLSVGECGCNINDEKLNVCGCFALLCFLCMRTCSDLLVPRVASLFLSPTKSMNSHDYSTTNEQDYEYESEIERIRI
jgi:hypothetical protein